MSYRYAHINGKYACVDDSRVSVTNMTVPVLSLQIKRGKKLAYAFQNRDNGTKLFLLLSGCFCV